VHLVRQVGLSAFGGGGGAQMRARAFGTAQSSRRARVCGGGADACTLASGRAAHATHAHEHSRPPNNARSTACDRGQHKLAPSPSSPSSPSFPSSPLLPLLALLALVPHTHTHTHTHTRTHTHTHTPARR
jgi:hypothetical protein